MITVVADFSCGRAKTWLRAKAKNKKIVKNLAVRDIGTPRRNGKMLHPTP
jgi:hypothetical protein